MDIVARLRSTRIAPRKMRLVANTLRGRSAQDAEVHLTYLPQRGADVLLKLLRSAMANAKQNFDVDPKNLVVHSVTVGSGVTMKRIMARARGSAYRIEKKTSHVDLVLTEKTSTAGKKSGKKSELVTRSVHELSEEELAHATKKHDDHGHSHDEHTSAEKPDTHGASDATPIDRRSGEK